MGHLTEALHLRIHPPCFKMRRGRAVLAKVDDRAISATLTKSFPVRPHRSYFGDKIFPSFGHAAFSDLIDTIRMPQAGAETKKTIVADGETMIPRSAAKKMTATDRRTFGIGERVTIFPKGAVSLGIAHFQGDDITGRKPLPFDLLVTGRVAIVAKV